ncbi:bacillithiol transferase BstA [Bacillus inaquosorum]|uniref:Putative metal-dependent hydrolase BSI_28190 n=1 Tax=Bacillus inaquosorum KCTC 13429 TaxID=1236548 RepID=A0A9W5LGR1_9BACI|nr:bacillithiol transferase BstA [Bacillus inaquosorum]AWM16188.1 putative metal-dependent hydrolase [Bacillus inaquosorum]ELS60419.1 YfiT [Bacillus inaquosorum KCTC 13429]MCY8138064.1 bacillithiol transferase BstA [Bacillus inaquosorum]MCY8147972.1 bacillithiol transferase BstA [Bacillus inaquosorum]MCY8162392.1 bacillithiol transferase BstA [Bacillus inaquosorum]
MTTANLSYPIGEYQPRESVSKEQKDEWIQALEKVPAKLKKAVEGMTESQLDTPYRDGGWTVRQVIHHLADSHMNSYIRFKLSLTEETPAIRPYDEKAWSELKDSKTADPSGSLALLQELHGRWTALLRTLTDQQFQRGFYHPDTKEIMTLENALGLYVWHSHHHIAHITELSQRMGWS